MSVNLQIELTDEQLSEIAKRAVQMMDAPADGWLRGAQKIAEYIDAPVSRVYGLAGSTGRIPVERDGSALIARKSELDRWLRAGGGKRP